MKQFLRIGLALFAALCVARMCAGCLTDTMKKDIAASTYEGQQKACIDRYETRAAIDKCRNDVKAAWASDASAEGGAK